MLRMPSSAPSWGMFHGIKEGTGLLKQALTQVQQPLVTLILTQKSQVILMARALEMMRMRRGTKRRRT